MSYLSDEVRCALAQAQMVAAKRTNRLRVESGGQSYPVLKLWENGFSVSLEDAPKLHGFADLYDGARHLTQCLIITSRDDAGQRIYELKRNTRVAQAPAIDYERAENAPIALIETS